MGGLVSATAFAQKDTSAEVTSPEEIDSIASPVEESSTEAVKASPKYTKWTALVASLTIFVLAVFVGFEIITKVPPTLHTPLMSGSNAISGISIVGALLATALGANGFASLLGFLAIILATVNVVGGYMVTNRMLSMFKAKR
ncbi:NAD(P) transhydrogenase subunit alpha [Blastopirellula marina]|uniref:proton-translocating NAD(P)(+) transhydrogenase n=1 Tax=Blastopirellula marina TaxID=124 RepID=A0A2S8G2I9_9BACT|nr:hypothetical protein C5Y98_11235 [Blastopirellula marina]PTL45330.1 NAD(P) transhydrogenase subunit alpha [Blastopirellula marina]